MRRGGTSKRGIRRKYKGMEWNEEEKSEEERNKVKGMSGEKFGGDILEEVDCGEDEYG
jgi:hypothetical protein